MHSHVDLEELCNLAKAKGASGAEIMASRGVVLDPRVRLKCMVPLCANYGRNLMCPPNVLSNEDFSKVLKKYLHTIVVQYPIPMNADFIEGTKDKKLEEVYDSTGYSATMVKAKRDFDLLLNLLESEAMKMGYRFATALSGGPCKLCDECVGQCSGEPCRHPFSSRPSMEAMGIDVYLTAKNAGLPFEIPAKDHPVWTGLLLVE